MSFYSFRLHGNTNDTTVEPTKENKLELEPWQIKQATVNKILLQGSDIQSITGEQELETPIYKRQGIQLKINRYCLAC
jgi:hypothetical protein